MSCLCFFFFKQKTAYEMRISDWSSDVCSSDLGEPLTLGEVEVTFVPAGHVLGSAQIVLDWRGERIVVSGDYKRRPDPTCAGFEPVPCAVFITEATFGLPVFRHPEQTDEIQSDDRSGGKEGVRPCRNRG